MISTLSKKELGVVLQALHETWPPNDPSAFERHSVAYQAVLRALVAHNPYLEQIRA